jgi:hypothetical protein
MGPLTKRRHSTRRGGKRQAGQPMLKMVTAKLKRYIGSRARRAAKKVAAK